MKVNVNVINTWYILVTETVTVPRLTMMSSTVSEESLARDAHTHTHTHTYTHTHRHTHTQTHTHTHKYTTHRDTFSKKRLTFPVLVSSQFVWTQSAFRCHPVAGEGRLWFPTGVAFLATVVMLSVLCPQALSSPFPCLLPRPETSRVCRHVLLTIHMMIQARNAHRLWSLEVRTICQNCWISSWSTLFNIYSPSCQLRSASDARMFRTPSMKTKTNGQRSFLNQAPTVWNELSKTIRYIVCIYFLPQVWSQNESIQTVIETLLVVYSPGTLPSADVLLCCCSVPQLTTLRVISGWNKMYCHHK